ncbi:DNA ligase 1-like [Trichomycterus rosablanca]|uniref:DNA ligase 1-like n=1 Tax=Trichomycterus rosablanca TaxID=2290929 RepID=UPI002F35645B
MKVVSMWRQMIQRLFGKRTKVQSFPKEEVKESGSNDLDENKEQEHLQAEMKDSHEIMLSVNMIFKKHAECTENLLRQMEKLSDVIEKTRMAKMEVRQASQVLESFTPSSSFRIRLPTMKKTQHSSVDSSLHPDNEKSSQVPKLAWDANESTEPTFLTDFEMNEMELQTVDESTEQETESLAIENGPDEPLDGNIPSLDIDFHAEMDKWVKFEQEEKLKLKIKMAEMKQRRQMEAKELKLKLKFLEKEAKREKQESKKKLKDLEKEVKNEKAMLLLRLKELKKKEKMEKKEECDEDKMEQHRNDGDEEMDEVQNENVLKIFKKVGFGRRKAVV